MKNIELTQLESKGRKLPLTEMIVEGENEMRAASRLFALLNSNGARRLRYKIETALVSGVKSVLRQVVGRQILRPLVVSLELLPGHVFCRNMQRSCWSCHLRRAISSWNVLDRHGADTWRHMAFTTEGFLWESCQHWGWRQVVNFTNNLNPRRRDIGITCMNIDNVVDRVSRKGRSSLTRV